MKFEDFLQDAKERIVDLEKCFTGTLYDISTVEVLETVDNDDFMRVTLTMKHGDSHSYEVIYNKNLDESFIDVHDKVTSIRQ